MGVGYYPLIPFLISSQVGPDYLVRWFGVKDENIFIHSYQLLSVGYRVIDGNHWDYYAREIQALKAQYPGGWQNFAHKILPHSTFVFLDDFKHSYNAAWAFSLKFEDMWPADRELKLDTLIPLEMEEFVLAGFALPEDENEGKDDCPTSLEIPLPFREQRELRRIETLAKHNSWFEMHIKLKKKNPKLSGREISKEIAKMSIAEGATAETIRTSITQFKRHHVKKSPQSPS